jgi:CRISPR-associated exonuclease Cas4
MLEVTDLKQYVYCSRIPFYRYCLPRIRPVTYGMREGILSHEEEVGREERRSLRAYGLTQGERVFDVSLRSDMLHLVGRLDLAIRLVADGEGGPEAVVVDYKLTRDPAGAHYRLQLVAYALMLEEAWGVTVRRGYIYHIPLRKAEEVRIMAQTRRRVIEVARSIHQMVTAERLPPPPSNRARCITCEFRRFCNDAL